MPGTRGVGAAADGRMLTLSATQELRYYYDCIRVQVQDDAPLLVPLHAYPVTGTLGAPATVAFGACAVGRPVTRRIPLTCDVPIDVEYEVNLVLAFLHRATFFLQSF